MEDTVMKDVNDEEPVELTELFKDSRKTVTLADIITFQAILCVIISIVYIALNMMIPQTAVEIYNEFSVNYSMETDSDNRISEAVSRFLNSVPADYD